MAVPPLRMVGTGTVMSGATKSELRAIMRGARTRFAAAKPPIAPPDRFLRLLNPGVVIASYVAIAGEADPAALALAAAAHGARLALPHVTTADAPMRFLAWAHGEPMEAGPMGLSQPAISAAALTPDIVLTPLIAFDGTGRRLGQGGGYYDRAFALLPDALRIGIGWSIQQLDRVPHDRWDVPLDHIITEFGWIDRMPDA